MNIHVNPYYAAACALSVVNATMNAHTPGEHLFWFIVALILLIMSIDIDPPSSDRFTIHSGLHSGV